MHIKKKKIIEFYKTYASVDYFGLHEFFNSFVEHFYESKSESNNDFRLYF